MRDVTARLKELYRTKDADVLLMTSSGTGGLESAVQNVFSPGDEVLVPLAGFFSERWTRLAKALGLVVRTIDYDWGRKVVPDGRREGASPSIRSRASWLTHSETSTGVIQPIRELAQGRERGGALVVVDVVSSLGAVPFAFDEWGVDVAVGGSQKALSASPGIAFVAISDKAWVAHQAATMPRFYFDWSIYKEFADKPEPENPWTPCHQRHAGPSRRARALLPGRRGRPRSNATACSRAR
jgi:aspartate aminotransferase-like enzyme